MVKEVVMDWRILAYWRMNFLVPALRMLKASVMREEPWFPWREWISSRYKKNACVCVCVHAWTCVSGCVPTTVAIVTATIMFKLITWLWPLHSLIMLGLICEFFKWCSHSMGYVKSIENKVVHVHWRHVGEWVYCLTYALPQCSVEVSGHFHILAILPPGNEPLVPSE